MAGEGWGSPHRFVAIAATFVRALACVVGCPLHGDVPPLAVLSALRCTLSESETGTSAPTLDALIRIAHVLGESPDQLLEWTPAALSGETRKRAALMAEVEAVLAPTPLNQLEALVALLRRK